MHESTSTAMLATGQNPSVSVGKSPVQPPPVPSYKDKWVRRIYASTITNSTGGVHTFTVSSFGLPADTVVYVDKVQLWNLSAQARGVKCSFSLNNTTDLGNDNVESEDWSSLGQCPGVTFKVPLGHAKGVSNTATVVTAEALPTVTTSTTMVCHLHCWVAV